MPGASSPLWKLLGLLLAGAMTVGGWIWIQVMRRRGMESRWDRQGCCQHCGYDLRASVARCPECGEPTRYSPLPANAWYRELEVWAVIVAVAMVWMAVVFG